MIGAGDGDGATGGERSPGTGQVQHQRDPRRPQAVTPGGRRRVLTSEDPCGDQAPAGR